MVQRIAIAVMAKAPQPGRSKTRLVPPLDGAGAAALSAAFLRDITENIALAARDAPVVGGVAYAPAGTEALFEDLLAPGAFRLLADGSVPMPPRVQGFGRSLLHALQGALGAGFAGTCLLNADSPTLPTAYLRAAGTALAAQSERVVLGPAEDGGYYLLGANRAHAHLFEDIAWSTEHVAEQTRSRAAALGLDLLELPAWYDVDDQDGLRRLRSDLRALPDMAYPAPATFACLDRLGLLAQAAAE